MSERIKILHILPWLSGGGVEQRRFLLAKHLDEEKYEQHLVYMRDNRNWSGRFNKEGVKTYFVPGKKNWLPFDLIALGTIARLATKIRPDIIHGAVFEGVTMAALASFLVNIAIPNKCIIEETGDPTVRGAGGNMLMWFYCHLADHCVGVSQPITDYFTHSLKVDSSRVSLVENGARTLSPICTTKRREMRNRHGFAEDEIVVGTVCRLHDNYKRVSKLIEILSTMRSDARLLVVGDGPDRKRLEAQALQIGVSDRVTFAGFQTEIETFLGMMDIFALLSSSESFGLAVVEAMFMQLPVVATDVGGLKTLVEDGVNGYLVPGDRPLLAQEPLERLAADQALRRSLGSNGREFALSRYTEEAYVGRVDALYQRILQN